MKVKTATNIKEKFFVVAVVDENDLILVAGVFGDEATAAQVADILSTLLARTGLMPSEKKFPAPDVPFKELKELCNSWTPDKYTQLIKLKGLDVE